MWADIIADVIITIATVHSQTQMAASGNTVSKSLNAFFASEFSSRDERNLSSIVEEYFCFDSEEEEDHTPTGEYIYCIKFQTLS